MSPPRRQRASGRSAPGVRGGGGAVDDHQQAADHRRQVQPAEVEVQCRRVGLRVQLGDLPAVIREQRPKADEQHVVADADAAAERGGKLVGDDVHGEMRAAADADGGADEGQPGQRVFADLFHPEEAHRRQVERRRDPGHHVAQEDADEHVDHGHDHQRRHHDVRRPADDAKEGGHDGADRTGSTRRASSARRRAANLTRPRGRANVARRQEASMSRGQRSGAGVAVVVAMMLAGGSVKPAPSQAQSGAKKLDLAHIMPPPESGAIGYKYFADEVTKRSNGQLNAVCHGGTLLGKELEIMDAVKSGNIAFGTPVGAACTVFPELCVFLTPYLVRDYNHAYAMFNGEIGRQLDETFQQKYKVKIIYFYDYGFRHFWNNRKPITTPADLKGLKMRVQQGRVFADTVNGLGASAVPMPWGEVVPAAQQGVIDGADLPIYNINALKVYEVSKYVSMTYHNYGPTVLVMNLEIWKTLTPEQQKLFTEVGREAQKKVRELTESVDNLGKAKEILEAKGMKVNAADVASFRKLAEDKIWPSYKQQYGEFWDRIVSTK